MNIDIRIKLGFWGHPKTKKLEKRAGLEAVVGLMKLWAWVAEYRPDGVLSGLDVEDLELVADWSGEEGKLVSTLVDLRFLDVNEGGVLTVHDWQEHNTYASETEERSSKAKRAAAARWSAKQDAEKCSTDAKPMLEQCSSNAQACIEQCSIDAQAMHEHAFSNAPRTKNQEPRELNTPPKEEFKFNSAPARVKTAAAVGVGDISHGQGVTPPASAVRAEAGGDNGLTSPPPHPQRQPSLEWLELREFYSENVRAEGEMAGYREFLTVCKERQWCGLGRITDDLMRRLNTEQWSKQNGKFRPSLARYLSEHMWTAPVGETGKDAPLPPPKDLPDGWDISKLDDPSKGDAFFAGKAVLRTKPMQTTMLPADGFIGRRRKLRQPEAV